MIHLQNWSTTIFGALRKLLIVPLAVGISLPAATIEAATPTFDTFINNGRVIDPETGMEGNGLQLEFMFPK